ncbi:MAG: DUF2993 domain-containing protein [Actinobacteria bacterium]|nr:MAG: DUF2993 domain-containing protein [Actinomycetota bacterium]
MRRVVRWLLAPVVILGVLFVVGNVIATRVAESKIASALESSFHLSARPSVKISGFPIITNILSGHVPRVSFSASSATFQGLTVKDINVTLVDVTATGGFLHGGGLTIKVGAGTVRARATEAAVNAYLKDHGQNATIAFHDGGATVRAVRSFLGRPRRFVATGTVAREGSSLVFRPTSVAVDGRAPPPGTRSLAEQKATLRVQLPPLPGGVSAYGIAAVDGGVALSAILRDQLLDLSS